MSSVTTRKKLDDIQFVRDLTPCLIECTAIISLRQRKRERASYTGITIEHLLLKSAEICSHQNSCSGHV